MIKDSNERSLFHYVVIQVWAENYIDFKSKFVLVCFSLLISN